MNTLRKISAFSTFVFSTFFCISAFADTNMITIKIKDHKFNPEIVEVPAGKKVKLEIINEDKTPAEFESHELKAEKIVKGNSKGYIFIGPLEKGEYPFFDEFNEDTTKGKVVVK
jgi:plastocyanin